MIAVFHWLLIHFKLTYYPTPACWSQPAVPYVLVVIVAVAVTVAAAVQQADAVTGATTEEAVTGAKAEEAVTAAVTPTDAEQPYSKSIKQILKERFKYVDLVASCIIVNKIPDNKLGTIVKKLNKQFKGSDIDNKTLITQEIKNKKAQLIQKEKKKTL